MLFQSLYIGVTDNLVLNFGNSQFNSYYLQFAINLISTINSLIENA